MPEDGHKIRSSLADKLPTIGRLDLALVAGSPLTARLDPGPLGYEPESGAREDEGEPPETQS